VWRGEGFVVISGERTTLKFGVVFLLAAGVEVNVQPKDVPHQELDMFVATCPPKFVEVYLDSPPPTKKRNSKRGSGSVKEFNIKKSMCQ